MKKFLVLFITIFLSSSSCKNVLQDFANQDSEEAILYQARLYLAEGQWTSALAEFARLSTATQNETNVVVDRASAYSGRCGLDFLGLADAIENLGTTSVMNMLLDTFVVSTAANFADCKLAEDLLKTVADVNGIAPTEKGKFLMAFNSLAKIGTILNFRGDTNDNGAVDAAWEPCDVVTGATDLPVAEVNEIGTGITLFIQNINGLSVGSDLFADVSTACTALGGAFDFCSLINTASMTAQHRQLIRGIVREDSDGLGLAIDVGQDVAGSACEP